jgi:hypothetical protein
MKIGFEGELKMALRWSCCLRIAAGIVLGFWGIAAAHAQGATFQPIPAGECQNFAVQIQNAIGFAAKASEDDFTDLTDNSDGRSCHISASASGQSFAAPANLLAGIAKVFPGWTDDPARGADGPSGAEKGFVNGSRIATVDVSWEPGPGVTCSDKEPLSACNIQPQQKLWNVTVDIIQKAGR